MSGWLTVACGVIPTETERLVCHSIASFRGLYTSWHKVISQRPCYDENPRELVGQLSSIFL